MFQLTSHFNAVMWWAFAALLAFEVMIERRRAGRRWGWPAAGLAAITLTVAASGEFHLILYLTGLLAYLVALDAGGRPGRPDQAWGPLAAVARRSGWPAPTCSGSSRPCSRGRWPARTAAGSRSCSTPSSVWALVRKSFGTQGEGLIYIGWPLAVLAALGLVAVLVRRRAALAYAVLAVPLVVLTYGARADIGGVHIYRFLFDHLPFLSLQRVPERLMVVTALVLVLLAVSALDVAGELLAGRRRALVAAGVVLCLATVGLLADYRVSRNRLEPDRADNQVVVALRAATDAAGPVLGVPIMGQAVTWNSSTTYRSAEPPADPQRLQPDPGPWLAERVARLEPLNRGQADPAASRCCARPAPGRWW